MFGHDTILLVMLFPPPTLDPPKLKKYKYVYWKLTIFICNTYPQNDWQDFYYFYWFLGGCGKLAPFAAKLGMIF